MSGAFPISTGPALNQAQHAAKAPGGNPAAAQQAAAGRDLHHPDSRNTQDPAHAADASQQTAQAGKTADKSQEKHKQDKAFPALFASAMQDGNTDPAAVLKQVLTKPDPRDKQADAEQANAGPAAMTGMPMLAADGKGLPQLAWSGVVGVADNKGASALAMQGDKNQVISSPAVTANNLPNAVLKAQEQLAHAQLQQAGVAGNETNQFSAALNKEHLSNLGMAHQFMADNAGLPQVQTAAAASNVHNILAQDMNGLAATTTVTRGADSNLQQISVPVQQPQWSQQLGDRVHWLIGQDLHQAAIHLNPPELGALEVHIQMHGDQANVNFSSPHAMVRHAVDAAIPRLREMLHETGLTLGDVNVSGQALTQHQSRDPQNQQGQAQARVGAIAAVDEPALTGVSSAVRHLRGTAMLDVYA